MSLRLNSSGQHCEHETKFLEDDRIYLTWGGLDGNLGKLSADLRADIPLKRIWAVASQDEEGDSPGSPE